MEQVTLTAPQQRYVDWLCTAPQERVPATKKAMAVELGVDITTLRRWEKRPAFKEVWKGQVDEVQGSPERTQLYLQATNRMAPPTVEVRSEKRVAELSDSDLDELIAAMAKRERDARVLKVV
jgi:hypothetical protein